jgi:hypothetical protein
MDDKTNQQVVIDDISDVGADVRSIKKETRGTGRDVASLKDDVEYIQDQLAQIQKSTKTPAAPKKPATKRPVYNTRAGASTLTGVSLNEMALRIKSQSPGKSYSDARKEAKGLQNARQTLETGGGGVLGNMKSSLLRNTLGENLGGKVSRFLTSDKAKEKAAATLVNFDASKAERVQQAQPVTALAEQVTKLSDAVKQSTAVKVEAPKAVAKAVREDLSDAVAALKVLGYDMKEIKERLSTLPRGLTTEHQVKHALKSSADRVAAHDAAKVTAAAIKENTPPPVVTAAPTTSSPAAVDTPSVVSPVKAVRGGIPIDQLSQKKKEDAEGQAKRETEKDEFTWKDKVMGELHRIEDGIKRVGSESYIGLIVVALLAALRPFLGPILTVANSIWETVKTVFTSIEKFSSWATEKIGDLIERLTPSGETKNKVGGVLESVGHAIGKTVATVSGEDTTEMDADHERDQTTRANKQKFYDQKYDDGMIESLPKSYDEAVRRKRPYWIDDKYEKHNVVQRPESKALTSDNATKMEKQSAENSALKDNRTGMVIQPIIQPMKETQVAVPSGGGGGGSSLLALLDARNSEQSASGYMGMAYDHPAGYGAISRV